MSETPNETRWSLVILAKGDTPAARTALSELCEIYYAPVHGLIKRWSKPDEARDLTHAFFAKILDQHSIDAADPELGRFRNFLFSSAKHFLYDAHAKATSQKRGGKSSHVPLEDIAVSDPNALSPDTEFDRQWACALVDRCFSLLSDELEEKGKKQTFEVLRPWLAGTAEYGTQPEAALQLGISETAVRVLIHRLRKRFREIVEFEVAQTLDPNADTQS